MIDWPNALVGFVLGVVASLLFWIPDRIRAGRQRQDELWESWKVPSMLLPLSASGCRPHPFPLGAPVTELRRAHHTSFVG
jgi:hypothetical protein